MIEELKIKVKSFEYTRKHILIEGEKPSGERVVIRMSIDDLNFLNGRNRD